MIRMLGYLKHVMCEVYQIQLNYTPKRGKREVHPREEREVALSIGNKNAKHPSSLPFGHSLPCAGTVTDTQGDTSHYNWIAKHNEPTTRFNDPGKSLPSVFTKSLAH